MNNAGITGNKRNYRPVWYGDRILNVHGNLAWK